MTEKRKVLKPFRDGQDRNRPYGVNGVYPRDGLKVADERMEMLADKGFIEGKPKQFTESNTVDEIEAELNRLEIDYKKSLNKAEKLKLLNDADVE